jgi:type II secretory pathway pseudopilin PulG
MFNIAKIAEKVKQQLRQKPDKNSQNGISLIELLLIVAILLVLMVALYRTIGRDVDKARDADRKKDLKDIKVAFENYYNDNECYPDANALDNCGDTNLAPYLAQIPCDKVGNTYLYLPVNDASGQPCAGYRVLTQLAILNDPMIEQVGCPEGCGGIPVGMVQHPERYNYGISEGVPLNQDPAAAVPTIDPVNCADPSVTCYCCNIAPACNEYSGPPGACTSAAYSTLDECIANTACTE